MLKVRKYELEVCEPVYSDLSKDNNIIVETAGFIPLDVKLKRFEQAGIAAQFNSSEFTANDFRQLYANPDFELYPDDEFEEVQEKIANFNQFKKEYLKKLQENKKLKANKAGDLAEGKSPAEQAERASKKEQSISEKSEKKEKSE